MKLTTVRIEGGTAAVRADGDEAVRLDAADVGEVLRRDGWQDWAAAQDGPRLPLDGLDFAPLVPRPDKIVCVGLNYRSHILEMGRELPEHPTLFAKFRGALIGARDDITLPAGSDRVDWEAELGVVVGTGGRHIAEDDAPAHIAGYTVVNDITARDYQRRTLQWLQGKTFEATTPVGPWLVTPDEVGGPDLELTCSVNGEVVQQAGTGDLVFGPAALVSYLSTITTLEPGDVIATGTPGGVGDARTPPRYLDDGDTVVTSIAGVGELRNRCRREPCP